MQSLGYNQCCAFVAFSGVTMRGSLITAVYRKSLRLTSQSRQQSTSGEMVNMMSNDAGTFLLFFLFSSFDFFLIFFFFTDNFIFSFFQYEFGKLVKLDISHGVGF